MFTITLVVITMLAIIVLFSRFSSSENNFIARTVINCRDGPSWTSELPLVPFFPENLKRIGNFFQPHVKYVGKMMMIISKKFTKSKERLKLALRGNLNHSPYFLGNGRGPFLGERFGAMEASIS